MDKLIKQEIFEIEILYWLKNKGFLDHLLFGGDTMLRLCYDLNRYSADLDFWFYRVNNIENFFDNLRKNLEKDYELTDAKNKYHTLLFEIRKPDYPRRLKIEIRKSEKKWDFQEIISFSKFSNRQVLVKAFTMEQMMDNKIRAFLDRKEIRDLFDIEFLLRRGVPLNANNEELTKIKKIISSFSSRDYNVSLGSLLIADTRKYYKKSNFEYLLSKINAKIG